MPLPPEQLFAEIYRIHGHRCPMSTLGGRLGFAARQRLGNQGPFLATYYIDTCAADGISVMTGCQKSNGSLRIINVDRHALWLHRADGHGLLAELSEQTLELAGAYRTLDHALQKEEATLAPVELQLRRAGRAAAFEELLQRFRTCADEELMNFTEELPAALAGKE